MYIQIRIISRTIQYLITFLTIVIIAFMGIFAIPRMIGIEPYIVRSGSMEPELRTGSVAFIDTRKCAPESGDIIAFYASRVPAIPSAEGVGISSERTFSSASMGNQKREMTLWEKIPEDRLCNRDNETETGIPESQKGGYSGKTEVKIPEDQAAYAAGNETADMVVVTHRVIEKVKGGYVTKGDANAYPDMEVVQEKNIIGTCVCSVPGLGRVLSKMEGFGTALLVGWIAMLNFVGGFLARQEKLYRTGQRRSAEAYQCPAEAYQRPAKANQRPAKAYQRPAKANQCPAKANQRPMKPYQQPAEAYQRPTKAYQRPAKQYQHPVKSHHRQAKTYQHPVSDI